MHARIIAALDACPMQIETPNNEFQRNALVAEGGYRELNDHLSGHLVRIVEFGHKPLQLIGEFINTLITR
jgi:hypothetical protein